MSLWNSLWGPSESLIILRELRDGLQQLGSYVMTQFADIETLVAAIDAHTNDLAAGELAVAAKVDAQAQQIADLKAQIAAGNPVTPAQLDAVAGELGKISTAVTDTAMKLQVIGADPANPIPAPAPPTA